MVKSISMFLLLSIFLSGCKEEVPPELLKEVPVGSLVSVEEMSLPWNDLHIRSKVETTEGDFTVKGLMWGIKGEDVTLKVYSDDNVYLCTVHRPKCSEVY